MDTLQIELAATQRRKKLVNALAVALGQILTLVITLAFGLSMVEGTWALVYIVAWLVATSSLYFRYSRPVLVVVLVVVSLLVTIPAQYPAVGSWWAAPVMVYHLVRYFSKPVRIGIFVAALLASVVGGFVFARPFLVYDPSSFEFYATAMTAAFICGAIVTIAWFFGDSRRLRENRHRALIERNRQLEHEREQERALAALDERARIAREMHDIVAHSLSVIIAQADGARYAAAAQQAGSGAVASAPNEPVELAALGTISEAARSSLQQMRTLLGVLRTDEGTTVEPLPALHNVPQLIEQTQKLGIPVRFSTVSGVEEKLPQGADLTIYRIVQEALTNVAKHCPGTPLVTVTISEGKQTLDIDITNLPQAEPTEPLPGARRGLLGMRERVDMYHGTLHYGRLADGSFRVFAQIPFVP